MIAIDVVVRKFEEGLLEQEEISWVKSYISELPDDDIVELWTSVSKLWSGPEGPETVYIRDGKSLSVRQVNILSTKEHFVPHLLRISASLIGQTKAGTNKTPVTED